MSTIVFARYMDSNDPLITISSNAKKISPEDFFAKNLILLVRSTKDGSVLIATDLQYSSLQQILIWWDTKKVRAKQFKSFEICTEQLLQAIDINQINYQFLPLTIDLYNLVVKPQISSPPDFADSSQMISYFQRKNQ